MNTGTGSVGENLKFADLLVKVVLVWVVLDAVLMWPRRCFVSRSAAGGWRWTRGG